MRFREVADGDERRAAGEDRAKNVVRMAREKMLQIFAGVAIGLERIEKARDGFGYFIGTATVADGTRDGRDVADTTAHAKIVGVDKFAIDLDFLAFDANVGDPMLAATVGATGDVQLQVMLEIGIAVLESFGQPASEALGFGKSKFAKFGTGASDSAANECGAGHGEPANSELRDDGGEMRLGDVDEEQILHRSGADVAVGIAFGEIGGKAELRGRDASTNDGGTDGEEAGLLLGDDAEMIAMNVGGDSFRLGGIESKAEMLVNGSEEGVGRPVMFEEKIFHAGAVAALAKNVAGAEDFSDGADDGNNLVRLDESIEADGEMRLRGEAAGYPDTEAKFVIRNV